MTEYVVLSEWTADFTGDRAAAERGLHEQIVPSVRAMPGFRHGIWSASPGGDRLCGAIVFDGREAAEKLVDAVQGGRADSAAAGVHLHSIEIQSVNAHVAAVGAVG